VDLRPNKDGAWKLCKIGDLQDCEKTLAVHVHETGLMENRDRQKPGCLFLTEIDTGYLPRAAQTDSEILGTMLGGRQEMTPRGRPL